MTEEPEVFSFAKSKIYAEKLERKYPFLSCTIIGRSYSGRGIFSFSVGNIKNSVVITGGTGAGSGQTSLALYRFIERICDSVYLGSEISGIDFSSLTRKFGVTIIPCLSPDSCEAEFNLSGTNSAGVDINLNFDSDWHKEKILSLEKNILFAGEKGYPGISSESEPETRAFVSLCRRRCFRSCLSIINDDDKIYYVRSDKTHISSPMMAKILASSFQCEVMEEEMPPSPSRWFCDAFSKPSFLLMSKPCENSKALYEKLEEALVLTCVM